jgi:two-component sensor histidine kinase
MRTASLLQSARARLQPRPWGALLALLALAAAGRLLVGDVSIAYEVKHLAKAYLLAVAFVALAPVPWQWTGTSRRLARPLRGLAQALPWNALWIGLALLTVTGRPVVLHMAGAAAPPAAAHMVRTFHSLGIPLGFLPLLMALPLALGAGWLIAAFQAAEGDRAEAQEGRRAMEVAAREAQEQALKAQLDPHVLYNALGGITELIHEDPARAEEALVSLAEMYRKLTALGRRATITLGEERTLVEHYLEVEKIRLGDRLRVEWRWPAALDGRSVPPLLVQPLVENAIKHGLAPRKGGGMLRIEVAPEGQGLRFTVANDGEPLDPAWNPATCQGTGLSNLAQRLALLGGGSRLDLGREGAWTRADLLLTPGGGR